MKRSLFLVLLGMLFGATPLWAAQKLYVHPETPITFADGAHSPTPSATLTMTGATITTGVGRISARYDLCQGVAGCAHALVHRWRCSVALTGTNIVDEVVEWWYETSDGTNPDGELGTADAALTTSKRNNLQFAGLLRVDQVTTNVVMTASGFVATPDRYVSWGLWNATSLPFQTSTSVHLCSLTPVPLETNP